MNTDEKAEGPLGVQTGYRRDRCHRTARRVAGLGAALALFLTSCASRPTPDEIAARWIETNSGWILSVGSILAAVIIAVVMYRAAVRQQKERKRILLERGVDPARAVGLLAEMLYDSDMDIQATATTELVKLLPRLKASHAVLLDDRQRNCLHRALTHPDSYLFVAVLKALEQVGDERAIPHVERLARAAPDVHIQTAANKCLNALRARIERERSGYTLLRPAQAPGNPADVLLRPAHGISETDPRQLLRPASPGETER